MIKTTILFVFPFAFCLLLSSCMVNNTVTDIDGNVYRTIIIGKQEWMAENLKTTQFRNGTPILNILDIKAWEENVSTAGWAYYDNDETNDAVYGKLYNWFAVSDSQGLCPEGWHMPSDNEWNILIDYLGGAESAGCKMKEEGTSHWEKPNSCANNSSSFTGLPAGYRDPSGFVNIGRHGGWWSADENNEDRGWFYILNYNNANVYHLYMFKKNDISVRCVKD